MIDQVQYIFMSLQNINKFGSIFINISKKKRKMSNTSSKNL